MRRISSLLVVGLTAGTLVSSPAPDVSAAPTAPHWQPCHEEAGPDFECASFDVPLDHDRPRGAKISLELVRLPATDPANRQGSIFFNPGGPGGSGVDFLLAIGPSLYSDQVRARFDLIGFDPRGIMASEPLLCFDSLDDAVGVLPPFAFPMTGEEEQLVRQLDKQLAKACQGERIADHMATADVARDLDLLRQAVGDPELNYVGYSYGSFLGATYANMFPDRVGALVVDGVLDPIAWTTGRGREAKTLPFSTRLRSDAGAQATLDEFFRLCDEAGPDGCAFAPDSAARYAALADRLRAGPIEIVDPDTGEVFVVRYSDLIGESLGSMYSSFEWPFFAETLASIESLASAGSRGGSVAAKRTVLNALQPDREIYPNFIEGFPGVACSDSVNPNHHRFWSKAGADADEQFGYFGRIWTWVTSPCATWKGADRDRYLGPFTRNTANPVLVVGTRYDPATRYEGAVTVDALLPNSALLTVEGWGHTSLFLSICADETVSQYLLTGETPAPGTTCDQDFGPFGPSSLGSADDDAAQRQLARAIALEHVSLVPRD